LLEQNAFTQTSHLKNIGLLLDFAIENSKVVSEK